MSIVTSLGKCRWGSYGFPDRQRDDPLNSTLKWSISLTNVDQRFRPWHEGFEVLLLLFLVHFVIVTSPAPGLVFSLAFSLGLFGADSSATLCERRPVPSLPFGSLAFLPKIEMSLERRRA